MPTLFDIARMTTGTIGTGTITLGAAAQSFLTFAAAGVADQNVVRYLIEDPPNREVGTGTYTASGTTLTRTVTFSTNSNNPISLSGSAQVALTALAEDIVNKAGDTMVGALNWSTAVTLASAATVNIGAAASNYIIISGTTSITAFDTIAQGAFRWVRFQASLTLTNSASLICIGSANVQTAAGDIAQFTSEGSGNWRMMLYQKASGAPLSQLSPTVDIRTASATITIPTGASKAKITMVGGGGGGAGSTLVAACCVGAIGGGGGAGAVLIKYLSGLTAGNTLTLTIGSGGSAGVSGGGSGGNGGDTTLVSGTQTITTLTAGKGTGGTGSVSGAAGTPGTATNGDVNIKGGANLSSVPGSPAGNAVAVPGMPALGFSTYVSSGAANGFGGGGNGAPNTVTSAGGAGSAGLAIFEWYA